MRIHFLGNKQGMTEFQKEELRKILALKECSEFTNDDSIGAVSQANTIALVAGVKIFSIYPLEDYRKRAFYFDSDRATKHNKVPTPYLPIGNPPVNVKWYPIDSFLNQNKQGIQDAALIVAAPKEFQYSTRSGTWSAIRVVWQTKKNDILIIPPVDRPEE